jgi:hypothetical protein
VKKGCVVTVVVVVLGVAGVVATYLHWYNPYYHSKRVRTWARQAIDDPTPEGRREAAQALAEAFRGMRPGEPRIQLVMQFCYARQNDQGEYELPEEVLPFLIETLHAREIEGGSYQCCALSQVKGGAAVPALIEVIKHDDDPHARYCAACAIRLMGTRNETAMPLLRRALDEGDEEVRRRAAEALNVIEGDKDKAEKKGQGG